MRPLARHVFLLGSGQTLGYASSYCLPALLAAPMARDTGLPLAWVFAAFSLSLLVSAIVGPAQGAVLLATGLGLLAWLALATLGEPSAHPQPPRPA